MTIETKELIISEELKRKVEMICRFAYVDYPITNGSIKSINIAMIKPHIVKIKDINYLIFDENSVQVAWNENCPKHESYQGFLTSTGRFFC